MSFNGKQFNESGGGGGLDPTKINGLDKADSDGFQIYANDSDWIYSVLPYSKTPLSIEGCSLRLWLDADQITGLTDGDAVSTWSDESREGNDASQSTEANKPTYQTNELNSKPVVRFDGSNDYLSITDNASLDFGAGDFTFFAVVLENTYTSFGSVFQKRNGSNPYPQYNIGLTDSNYASFSAFDNSGSATGNRVAITSDTLLGTEAKILAFRRSGSDFYGYQNGNIVGSDLGKGTINTDTSNPLIIGNNEATSEGLDGDIAEIIIYDLALSDTDREKIETYLSDKYDITI